MLQQQLQLQQLLYFRETTGINIPSKTIIEASTLQNKDTLLKDIMEQEKAASDSQQKQEQMQLRQMEVDNQTKMSYARSQEGLAKERIAKIDLDKALNKERIASAREERSKSVLNWVEAIKNLQEIDLNLLEKSISIAERIRDRTQEPVESSEHSEDKMLTGGLKA